ncbi:hypothetical protein EG832_19470, partial [bacterium]|nr:hypothetical protein [bacterium]
MKKASKKSVVLISSILIVVAGIAFGLADRYLIRHVQIADVSVVSAAAEVTATPAVPSDTAAASTTIVETQAVTEVVTQTVTYDDWNY